MAPPQPTPEASVRGGGEKHKGRGDQSDLKQHLRVVWDGPAIEAKKAATTTEDSKPKGKGGKTDPVVDVVCVPGLGADPVKTWIRRRRIESRNLDPANPSHEKFKDSPSMVEDKTMLQAVLPRSRIMLYHYASQWWGEGAVDQTIDNVVAGLLQGLKSLRKDVPRDRPIIFIGHSLGGIVIEKAVVAAKLNSDQRTTFNAIAGAIFLGTPFSGSPSQFKASMVAQILEPTNLAKFNSFLKLLEAESDQLKGLRDDFLSIALETGMRTCNFFELKKTNLNMFSNASKWFTWADYEELIAPQEIAVFQGREKYSLNVDHSGLNKFDSPSDENWIVLKTSIKDMADKAAKAVKSRQNALPEKISEEAFKNITEALRGDMQLPNKKLEKIEEERASSLEGMKKLTLEQEKIRHFLDTPEPGVIWLTMLPGQDKGMRAHALIREIERQTKAPVMGESGASKLCYFFCENTAMRNNTLNMLKAFCYQLISDTKPLAEYLPYETKSGGKKTLTYDSVEILKQPFIAMTRDSNLGVVNIVIDGLDSLEELSRQDLFDTMRQSLFAGADGDLPIKVKWILIGLARKDIQDALQRHEATILAPEDLGSSEQMMDSLRVLVREKITILAKRMKYRRDVLFSLRYEILQRSEGNATWVDLACGEIESVSPRSVDVRSFVERLKQGLTELYDQIQNRVLKSGDLNLEYTKEILRTMMIVVQYPTIQELAILADLPDECRHDEEQIKQYIGCCGSFLKIVETIEDETWDEDRYEWVGKTVSRVQFIDESARKHLAERAANALGLTEKTQVQHGILALRCLSYLQGEEAPDITIDTMSIDNDNNDDGDSSDGADESKSQHSAKALDADAADEEVIAAAIEGVEYPALFWIDHAKLATTDVVEDFQLDNAFWERNEEQRAMLWWPRMKQLEDEHPALRRLTPVHLAAYFDFVPLLEELLSAKVEKELNVLVNRMDSYGRQPLYWAAHQGNIRCVKILIEHGANADARSHNSPTGVCALHGAAFDGSVEVAEYLIYHGAQLDVQNEKLGTPLCAAASSSKAEMLVFLLEKGATFDAPKNYWYRNVLGAACWVADTMDVVKPLLDREHDINIPDCDGDWPIYAPALYQSTDILAAMLETQHNANVAGRQMAWNCICTNGWMESFDVMKPHIEDLDHEEALYCAARQGMIEIFKKYPVEFITQDIKDKSLYVAVDGEYSETVELLIKQDANVNAQLEDWEYKPSCHKEEWTLSGYWGNALQASAIDGTVDITTMLLDAGADPNLYGGFYGSPIQAAAVCGSADIVTKLIEKGADINAGPHGAYGNALYAAAATCDVEVTKILIDHDVDVNAQGGDCEWALAAAIQAPSHEIMTLLLNKGANINAICTTGDHCLGASPLILAALNMPKDATEELLERGADPSIVDKDGMTALICAAECPNSETVGVLVPCSDIHHVSWKTGDALQAAAKQGDEDSVKILLDTRADVNGPPTHATLPPPLWLAACDGEVSSSDFETFRLLVERGADGHFRKHEDVVGPLLARAVKGGDKDIIAIVLDKFASINDPLPGDHGSALQMLGLLAAAEEDDPHTVVLKWLFERDDKPDVNQTGGKYHTAIQAFCYRGYGQMVDFILSENPDITIRGGFYGSALGAAAAENDINTLDKLEEKFGDAITQELKDEALHYAVHYECIHAIEKLLAMGADPLSRGKWGTVMENWETGFSEEDMNSDDPKPTVYGDEEEEEMEDPAKEWDEPIGVILINPDYVELQVEETLQSEKSAWEVQRADWISEKPGRKKILEDAIKKVREERGIADEPELAKQAEPAHEPSVDTRDRSLPTNTEQPCNLPGLGDNGIIRRLSGDRSSLTRKPVGSPAPSQVYGGPPAEGQAYSVPTHGRPLLQTQFTRYPQQTPPNASYEGTRGPAIDQLKTPRPSFTPQASVYGDAAASPPNRQPVGMQRVVRKPIGGRSASGSLSLSVKQEGYPTPPAESAGFDADEGSFGGQGGYDANRRLFSEQGEYEQQPAYDQHGALEGSYGIPKTQGYSSRNQYPAAGQPYGGTSQGYDSALSGYTGQQTACGGPQPGYNQPSNAYGDPKQNSYGGESQQRKSSGRYDGVVAGAAGGTVGGAACYGAATLMQDDDSSPHHVYQAQSGYESAPIQNDKHSNDEPRPQQEFQRRYSWEGQQGHYVVDNGGGSVAGNRNDENQTTRADSDATSAALSPLSIDDMRASTIDLTKYIAYSTPPIELDATPQYELDSTPIQRTTSPQSKASPSNCPQSVSNMSVSQQSVARHSIIQQPFALPSSIQYSAISQQGNTELEQPRPTAQLQQKKSRMSIMGVSEIIKTSKEVKRESSGMFKKWLS